MKRGVWLVSTGWLVLGVTLCAQAPGAVSSAPKASQQTSGSVRKLLAGGNLLQEKGRLAELFRSGDEQIELLVAALKDPDESVRLNAQRVIRYLGNPRGIQAVHEDCRTSEKCFLAGTIPVPLDDWDYEQIATHLLCTDCRTSGAMMDYRYALAIDGSERARAAMSKLAAKWKGDASVANPPAPGSLIVQDRKLDKELLKKAFFLSDGDRKVARVNRLAVTRGDTKRLYEIHVNPGPLVEQWFHVVVVREGKGWRYLSVAMVAIS